MVPEGWKKISLEHVAEVRSGVAKGKSGLKDPITIPYLRVANVQDGHINLDEVKEIQIERDKLERYLLKAGDVLMNEGGDFDKLGRGDVWLGQIAPCLHQNHVFAVRPNQEKLDSFFLAALAASHYGKTYFLKNAKRSTNLASINSTQIKNFPTLVPPLAEQKKIAQILSTWDKAITTTEQLLANSQQQKKALMQQLLTGKKRLLDNSGSRFSGEFKRYQFSEVLEVDVKSISSKTPDNFEFNYISLSDVERGVINKKLDRHSYKNAPSRARRVVSEKDILLATVRPNLQAFAQVAKENATCIASTGFSVLTAKDDTCSDYVYQYLFSAHITGQINALVVGTNYPAINSSDVLGLNIYCPKLEEQQKIATVLTTADQEIECLRQKLNALKQEKKALMQQLLTGKRRVKP